MTNTQFRTAVQDAANGPTAELPLLKLIARLDERASKAVDEALALGFSGDELNTLRGRMVRDAEALWMRTRYASVDLSFTENSKLLAVVGRNPDAPRRPIFVRPATNSDQSGGHGQDEEVVELPGYVVLWNFLEDFATHSTRGRGHFTYQSHVGDIPSRRDGRNRLPAIRLCASVVMPSGVTPEMHAAVRRALAYLRLFEVGLMDCGLSEHESSRARDYEVGVLWAPTFAAWSFTDGPVPVPGDPAILVRHCNGPAYLVVFYDTPDERPIEHIIREFSDGAIPKTKPQKKRR